MKNKILSILAIFITFITLSCKTDLIEKEITPQGKGLISIKIGNNAKMLSPNTQDTDLSSITQWTVTFTNKQDTTKQLKRTTTNGTLKEYLPFGTYIIEIEGITQSDDDGSSTISFYGKTEASISKEEKTTTANIYVAPKKSENGTGSFEYSITMEESDYVQPELNTFTAKLSSVNNNSASIEIEATVEKNETETYTTYTITFTKDDIPSGYYTLTVSCTQIPNGNNPNPITQILQKNILVEICDNAKTYDSIELQVEDYKTLYAVTPTSNDGNKFANYSGEFKQYPADFLNILNDDTITNAEIYMLNGNIPIINPSKIKDKFFDIICLYNENAPDTAEYYGNINNDYDKTALFLSSTKELILLGNDNYQESILNLYCEQSDETTTVTLLNGSPSIYLSSSSSSKFEFNIKTLSDYYDKPFMQYDSEEEEYLLRIFDDTDYTKIASFDGITLNGNENDNDKVVYTSIPQQLNDELSYKIQYFILPSQNGTVPDYTINANKTNLYIDENVTFAIEGNFTDNTKFKWYANRKLVQDSTEKSYTHTAEYTTDEVLCFIYQDENNYKTVNATEQNTLNITTDNTPVALYSATNDYNSLYNLTLTDVKNISKGISSIYNFADIYNETSHIDNCYGKEGTLWWITDSEIYNSNNSESAVIQNLNHLRYIDFDAITNTLYATTMDANATIYKITEDNGTEPLFTTEAPITCITFNDGYCYTIEEAYDTETQYTLKKYNLSKIEPTTGQLTSEVETPLLTKTTKVDDNRNETITFTDLIFDDKTNSNANTLKNPLFSDIQVTEEGIFVLFNDCYLYDDTINDIAYSNSRGGIIKFNSDLNLDSSFGSNGIFGWTNTMQTSSGKNTSSDPYTIYSYMPKLFDNASQISTEHFYGPRKFIAIKPKKLIFTDDGFRFYCDNDESTDGKPTNHVIEFDIETALFNSYNLDTQVKFDKEPIQYGYVIGSFSWDN